MKNVRIRKLTEKKELQCVLCQANFEIWLENLQLDSINDNDLRQKLLKYCPICTKKDESK